MTKKSNNISRESFVNRMRELADIKKPVNEGLKNSTLVDFVRASNGTAYGIIKENHQYFIKISNKQSATLDVTDFAYIGGLENKLKYEHKSVSEADKNRNFYLITINESHNTFKAAIADKKTTTGSINEAGVAKAPAAPASATIVKDGTSTKAPIPHSQTIANKATAKDSMPKVPAAPAGATITNDSTTTKEPIPHSQTIADKAKGKDAMPKVPAEPAGAIVTGGESKNSNPHSKKSSAPIKPTAAPAVGDTTLKGKATKDGLKEKPKSIENAIALKEGEFGKEEDEKSDIAAAADAIGDLDIAADSEKAADSAPVGNEPAAEEPIGGGEPASEPAAPELDATTDIGGEPSADGAPADLAGDEPSGEPETGAEPDAAGNDDEKMELKKLVGKVQNLASSNDLTPDEVVGQLKQIIAGYKEPIDSALDDAQRKEVANTILKPKEDGAAPAGLENESTGFKKHISDMGYDPSDAKKMSMMEMVGIMNSWFGKNQDGEVDDDDMQTVAEYMNDDIEKELQECGFGDYAEKAKGFRSVDEAGMEYGSEEPMDAEAGDDDISTDSEEVPVGGGEEEPTSELPGSEVEPMDASPMGMGAAIAPAADVLSGAGSIGSIDTATGKKQVSIDLKNDKIDFSISEGLKSYVNDVINERLESKKNETKKLEEAAEIEKMKKVIKRRIEEKLSNKKPVLTEAFKGSKLLAEIDKYIDSEIIKRSK